MATPILQKNLQLFIEANELAGAGGSAVSTATDLSGWARNMTQLSSQPVIEASAVNGKKAIVFDGTSNPLQTADEPITVNSGFLVINIDEFTNYNGILSSLETYGILAGKNNTPYFYDFTDFRYYEVRVNDRIYPRENAPITYDQWIVVFFRTWLPTVYDGIQIGRDRLDNTRKADFKIALLALYNREWCESDIRLNTESIAYSYQLPINNVFPYQGSKTDTGEYAIPHLSDGQIEPVIRLKSDRSYAAYDLDFQNRRLSEYKAARDFYLSYYPDERFIYRHYNEIPPVDFIVRGTTTFQDRGNNGALKNYGFGVAESEELSEPQIPTAAPVIPVETNDIPADEEAPTVPGTPTFAGVAPTTMTTNWTAATDNVAVTGYELQRATDSGFTANLQTFTLGNVLTHNETGLSPSTTYYFRVRARDAAGNWSAYSGTGSQATAAPDTTAPTVTSFTATPFSSSRIDLAWSATDNVAVTGYDLDWSPNGSSGWTTLLSNILQTTYNHTGLTAETQYFYRLRARDAAGNVSSYSTDDATTLEAPAEDAIVISDGDSRSRQIYYDGSPAGTNLHDKLETLLTGVATVETVAVAGGALNTGSGDLNLTASADTRMASALGGSETYKIVVINSSFNDLMAGKTPEQYMTALEDYFVEVRSLGATHIVAYAPSESDYLGQKSNIHIRNLKILDLLKTEFSGATPFGNADNYYLNPSSDNVIGLEADTHDSTLYYTSGGDSKLHWGEGFNDVASVYIAEFVKRLVGAETTPSIPTGIKLETISDTEIGWEIDPAFDGIAVTSRAYSIDGNTPVSIGTSLSGTISGLMEGTEYQIEFRATNGSGNSGWSPVKSAFTYPDFTGWSPTDLINAIYLRDVFQDTAQTTPATALNDPIAAAQDEFGVDHFVQATSGLRPVLKPNTLGLLPGWYFAGDGDRLVNTTAGSLFTGNFTFIVPINISNVSYSDVRQLLFFGDETVSEGRGFSVFPFDGEVAFTAWNDISTTGLNIQTEYNVADGSPRYVTFRKTGTLVEIFIGKTKIVSGRPALSTFTSATMTLGSNNDGTSSLQGHLGETILVSESLSDLDLFRVWNHYEEEISGGLTNYALASNGSTVTASSSLSGFPVSPTAIDGILHSAVVPAWHSNSGDLADGAWVEIDFGATRLIEQIDVIGMKDDYTVAGDPVVDVTTNSLYGNTAWTIEYYDGSYHTITACTVTGNNKVWRRFTFTPVSCSKIRWNVTANQNSDFGRLCELQAWG